MADMLKASDPYDEDVNEVMQSSDRALVELELGDLLMIASQLHAIATAEDLNKLQVLELLKMARYLLVPVEQSFPRIALWRRAVERVCMERFVSH